MMNYICGEIFQVERVNIIETEKEERQLDSCTYIAYTHCRTEGDSMNASNRRTQEGYGRSPQKKRSGQQHPFDWYVKWIKRNSDSAALLPLFPLLPSVDDVVCESTKNQARIWPHLSKGLANKCVSSSVYNLAAKVHCIGQLSLSLSPCHYPSSVLSISLSLCNDD